ncbi:MAG: Eco57I restriction-modification methylase domain-containing protein, partial [Nannocystaceae bacterium]
MDGVVAQFESLRSWEPKTIGGFSPGGNPRYAALAHIAVRVAKKAKVSPIAVLRAMLKGPVRAQLVAKMSRFVDQLTYERPDEPATYTKRTRANLAAIDVLAKGPESIGRTDATKLYGWTGWGGLKLEEHQHRIPPQYRQHSLALLHEWYTPSLVADAVADLLVPYLGKLENKFGAIKALEPSAGVGRFLDAINRRFDTSTVLWTAVDLNPISIDILRLLHPYTRVHYGPYELFNHHYGDQKFDLVVANPPFGSTQNTRTFALLDPVQKFMEQSDYAYFLKRTIHALSRCGLAVFVLPRSFLSGTSRENRKLRSYVFRRVHLLKAFRMPSESPEGKRTFPAMATVTDVMLLQSRGGLLNSDAPDDKHLIAGDLFKHEKPDWLLGTEGKSSWNRYQVIGEFHGFPEVDPREECMTCTTRKEPTIKVTRDLPKSKEALAFASSLGLKSKAYLGDVAQSRAPKISWDELQTGFQDIVERHGNPAKWTDLTDYAQAGDKGAQALLRAFE